MSDLFAVRVLNVTRQVARLRVTSVHPDSGKPAPRAVFALMLMYDPIEKSGDAEFSKYSHLGDSAFARLKREPGAFSSNWMDANAQAFVAKVKQVGAALEVHPTHPEWIAHLRKGMAWRTTAYDAGPGLPAEPRAPAPGVASPTRGGAKKAASKAGARKATKKAASKAGAKKKATKVGSGAKKVAKAKRST
ncbi:hypothetical protein [Corallococcus exercitus]|uniref:hypothetical protein n=1 Tax=Corallococcus exercitus TaxID=2316736 RepID=UPI0035D422B9